MIPGKLELRNFMPYREAGLSFEGLHVVCLCGDNGNGKSALLDAITWVLWGKARAKTDDELIHTGTTEMGVEFEFAVGQEHYRVIRKRSKPKANRPGHPTLDLQISADKGFRSISGNSIRETEDKIIDILRMDYDTFINSAYLLQGQADRFSKAEPYKRKEVLAYILGLARYDELERRAKDYVRQMESQQSVLLSEIERLSEELSHKSEYEAQLMEAEQAVTGVDRERQALADKVNDLMKHKNDLDSRVRQREEIEARVKQAESAISTFKNQVREHKQRAESYEKVLTSYNDEIATANAHLDELSKQENTLEEKRKQNQEMSNRIHQLSATNSRLKAEMNELKEKITMLEQEEATCPLCGTELGAEGRDTIMANYERQGQDKREAFRANESEIGELDKTSSTLRQEVNDLERKLREGRAQWERRTESLNRDHDDAQSSLPKERETINKAEEDLERWRSTLKNDIRSSETLDKDLVILPQLETDLSTAQKELDDAIGQQSHGRQVLGAIQEKLERCISLEKNKTQKSEEAKHVSREASIYGELALAFGKKGIQAMIIENVLPEIEEEANRLLAKMTDNRMNVKIETQRAYKSRRDGELETLDINISDELGTRRYEMYSGGEAFRIDFALRIALSKLLAHRAGAPLPTLIVDEGFGSQDAGGRERLVEAINSIQDDFEKILVITHIEEMKEAFDRRIEVSKTADGSKVEVS